MKLASVQTLKTLLKKYQIRPSKKFGQNFLIDRGVLQKIISAAELGSEDTILEIGPGLGVLTQELAKKAKRVIAVEKDQKLIPVLTEVLKNFSNIEIIRGDILKIFNSQFSISDYKIVANLPYYIATPVIRKFLESSLQPKLMVLMTQKEVAQRITARPPKMNLLAVSVQFYAEPEIVSFISKKSFWPQPKVDSAVLKITPKPRMVGEKEKTLFFKIVKAGFSQPRKQIANNLSKKLKLNKGQVILWLQKNNIRPTKRAETRSWQKALIVPLNNF
jgi:16S rRNA (adenine1518-N6/adenine1519-N6)-dimethyltransferase